MNETAGAAMILEPFTPRVEQGILTFDGENWQKNSTLDDNRKQ